MSVPFRRDTSFSNYRLCPLPREQTPETGEGKQRTAEHERDTDHGLQRQPSRVLALVRTKPSTLPALNEVAAQGYREKQRTKRDNGYQGSL